MLLSTAGLKLSSHHCLLQSINFQLSAYMRLPIVTHSQTFVLNPSAVAFSETARFVWSEAPDGNSALISKVMFRDALGSPARRAMISSATWTKCIFAVEGLI
jgi:hypothetical protein